MFVKNVLARRSVRFGSVEEICGEIIVLIPDFELYWKNCVKGMNLYSRSSSHTQNRIMTEQLLEVSTSPSRLLRGADSRFKVVARARLPRAKLRGGKALGRPASILQEFKCYFQVSSRAYTCQLSPRPV